MEQRERERGGRRKAESAHSRLAQALRDWERGGSSNSSSSMASSHGRSDLRFADWMASLPQSMHTIPLTNLAIPGTCCFLRDLSKWVCGCVCACSSIRFATAAVLVPRIFETGCLSGERISGALQSLSCSHFCGPFYAAASP